MKIDVQDMYDHFLTLTQVDLSGRDEVEQRSFKKFFMAGVSMTLATMQDKGYELDEDIDMLKVDASVIITMLENQDEED